MNVSNYSRLQQFRSLSKSMKMRRLAREMCTAATASDEIKIPTRIERGPTDILKAIASTIGTDYTAPNYRFHDDPWLIPYSSSQKRECTIAKEAGRNAARYILENHPHLFSKNRIEAEPPITAFQPRTKYNRDNVTIELLENLVENHQVSDAVDVYELLVGKKKTISPELQQSLLEILAFYSEDEPLTPENMMSRMVLPMTKRWETGGLATTLYSQLATPQARLAMLLGLARHNQLMRAQQMWKEIEANNDPIPVEGYNAFFTSINVVTVDKLKIELVNTLTKMKETKVNPNAETLVACLQTLTRVKDLTQNYQACCDLAMSLMAEFKMAGVKPSLGAYLQLLDIFYTKNLPEKRPLILKDILDLLEQEDDLWPAQTLEDFGFFSRAMKVASILHSKKLAYRIHKLFLTGHNSNLLGEFANVDRYYHNFLSLIIKKEELDVSMDLFNKITPHIWSPRRDILNEMLREIQSKGAVQHIGKLFDDIELCGHGGSSKEQIYQMNSKVLRILDTNPSATSQFNNLDSTYVDITKRIFRHLVDNKASDGLYLRFNTHAADMCNMSIKIFLKEGQYDSAVEVFNFCVEEKERMPGELRDDVLEKMLDAAVEEEEADVGFQVIEYLMSMNAPKRAHRCGLKVASLNLNPGQKSTLNKLFSNELTWKNI